MNGVVLKRWMGIMAFMEVGWASLLSGYTAVTKQLYVKVHLTDSSTSVHHDLLSLRLVVVLVVIRCEGDFGEWLCPKRRCPSILATRFDAFVLVRFARSAAGGGCKGKGLWAFGL